MITDSYNKIKKTLNPPGRKMYLYSGHENNVAAILACAGVFEPHQPPYGATFLLELHHKLISNTFVFRVRPIETNISHDISDYLIKNYNFFTDPIFEGCILWSGSPTDTRMRLLLSVRATGPIDQRQCNQQFEIRMWIEK